MHAIAVSFPPYGSQQIKNISDEARWTVRRVLLSHLCSCSDRLVALQETASDNVGVLLLLEENTLCLVDTSSVSCLHRHCNQFSCGCQVFQGWGTEWLTIIHLSNAQYRPYLILFVLHYLLGETSPLKMPNSLWCPLLSARQEVHKSLSELSSF